VEFDLVGDTSVLFYGSLDMGGGAVGPTPPTVGKCLWPPARLFARSLWLSHTGAPCCDCLRLAPFL